MRCIRNYSGYFFIIVDSGYKGMEKIYVNSLILYEKPSQSNHHNKPSSKLRISVEHVIRELKKFNVIEGQNISIEE